MFHKVISRPNIVYSTVIFNILAFYFYYVISCLILEVSCFDQQRFLHFLIENKLSLYVLGASFLSSIFILKISSKINVLYYLMLLALFANSLYQNYNKVTLLALFIIAGFSFFFAAFWQKELEESYYNAKFDIWELNERRADDLKVQLLNDEKELMTGVITNWNDNGCFIRFHKPVKRLSKSVSLKITFNEKVFHQPAKQVVSRRDGNGAGFVFFPEDSSDLYNWKHLYDILYDRSYLPEYLM